MNLMNVIDISSWKINEWRNLNENTKSNEQLEMWGGCNFFIQTYVRMNPKEVWIESKRLFFIDMK